MWSGFSYKETTNEKVVHMHQSSLEPGSLSPCGRNFNLCVRRGEPSSRLAPESVLYSMEPLCRFVGHPQGPGDHSVLWNAMIYPFLNMTIKGALWYQGEANSRKLFGVLHNYNVQVTLLLDLNPLGAPETYHCTFPAMIDDWREKWYASTMQQTDVLFGFGFVQVCCMMH